MKKKKYQTGGPIDDFLKLAKAYSTKVDDYAKELLASNINPRKVLSVKNQLLTPPKNSHGLYERDGNKVYYQNSDVATTFEANLPQRPAISQEYLPSKSVQPRMQDPKFVHKYRNNGNPITQKEYDQLSKGKVLKEYTTGVKHQPNDFVIEKYNTGGDISSVLGAASPLLSLIPGAQGLAGPLSAFSALTSALSPLFESSGDKRVGNSPGAYADGGDISLSNQSFQVKGNPNVYDSEEYTTPNGPIKLDHNEVIKGSFAFSNRLRNPTTGNTFAEDVAPIEKSTAKASKRSTIANDPISNNTISANERRTESIATVQETLATLLGKRDKGMDPKNAKALGYQSGGSIQANDDLLRMYRQNLLPTTDPLSLLSQQPYSSKTPTDWEIAQFGLEGTTPGRTLPEVTISANRTAPPTSPRPVRTGTAAPRQPLSRAEEWAANMEMQRSYMATGQAPELTNDPFGFGISTKPAMSADQRAAQLTTPSGPQSAQTQPITNTISTTATVANNTTADPMRTTIGDIFQGVEVGSKFLQLLGGPEVEKPYLDRTQITKQAFDPRQAMYQNQANFQIQSNNIQTSSAPLRRALQNSLYAKKLDADSQILTQYQQLNNQATTQYQDRLSNRQRYNNQQVTYTDDINARNRGQFMNATQNAFTSLGNFGEALNTKRQNYDALNILRVMYPDVYGRITNAIR